MYTLDDRYLRPKKAAAMRRQHQAPYECLSSPALWQGRNATILPVRKTDPLGWFGNGGVQDENGHCVDISAVECCVKPNSTPETGVFRDEKVVYCGYMIHHWGHFLVEGVARLWYFLESDESVDKYVFAVDEGEAPEIRGNYKEFFVLLGIWDKLEFVNQAVTYREVIVPDLAFRRFGSYSPKYLDIFNAVTKNVPPPKTLPAGCT